METSLLHHIDSAYLLVGGKSSRFGDNKATVEVFGEPLLARLTRQMRANGLSVTLVAQNREDYRAFGIRTIVDLEPNAGPLAGVIAGLRDSRAAGREWSIITSCDMLDWHPEWLERLSSESQKPGSLLDAVFLGVDLFSPFPGSYRQNVCEVAEDSWRLGNRSLRGLHSALEDRLVKVAIEPRFQPKSFNTRAELDARLA